MPVQGLGLKGQSWGRNARQTWKNRLERQPEFGYRVGMIALSELRALPVAERLQLVEDLWDSIAEDQHSLPDHPALVEELRVRKARFKANPDSGVAWPEAKQRIRSGRA
jgi:putative addiction module component (TIGR02574 family)